MANGIFKLRKQILGLIQNAWTGQKTPAVEYLVVAGGGGGGVSGNLAGGGGAGGLLQGINSVITGTPLTVTVGSGGAYSTNGANSVFSNITALGGGYGGGVGTSYPSIGGSGGGGGGGAGNPTYGMVGASGISGQGNAGGTSSYGGLALGGAGGGGGAGTIGRSFAPSNGNAGAGGAGIASAISGTVTAYAGGGGGGVNTSANGGLLGVGGVGGGGNGSTSGSGTAGTTNTGGGGGGGQNGGATGGSGIVIISYPDVYPNASTQLNATYSTSGSGSVFFNGSTYLVGPSTSALDFGTGNYTVEFWIYPTATPSVLDIYFSASAGAHDFQIGYSPSQYLYSNFPSIRSGTSGSIVNNQWNHVALVRSGSNVALFSNGTRVGTTTDSTSTSLTNYYIATYNASPGSYNATNAYMSNLRIKNTAVYDPTVTTYTVPSTPFVSASTVLLMSTVSGAYLTDSSPSSLILSSVTGTPTWNQLSPFATGLGYKNRVYKWTSSGTITF
jgi:hypothetical protein